MKAIVMAGGQGTRLRPLTSNQPKPMLPIMGVPMMQHILQLLRRHGFNDVVITVQFLASIIRSYFGDGSDLDLSLTYATEEEPLGTAGSVKNAESFLDDTFLVISGDAVTDLDLGEVVRFHREKGAAVTVTVKRVEDPLQFGIVITDGEGRIERFLEKPGWGEVFSDQINTGIYVMEPEVLAHVPVGEEFDFAQDLFPMLLEKGLPMQAFATSAAWADVGNLDAYLAVHREALDRKVNLQIEGFELAGGIWLGEGAEIHPEATLHGPLFVGPNSRVEPGVELREYTVLGSNVVVKSGTSVHRAIVHDNAYIGPSTTLRGCVVGKNTDIKRGAQLGEGVVVGDACYVGEGSVLNPHVRVYPFKTVEPGALVSKSIIWESKGSRSLFGERGVSGLANIDITPDMALRVATAFASTLPKRAVIVTSRDLTRTARIVKRAMVAGVNAAGVDVHDLELAPIPLTRFYARSAYASAGIAVRTLPLDPSSVEMQFFDGRGIDLDPATQRKVERLFYRDDLRRAFHHEIGELSFPARGRDYYLQGMLQVLDAGAMRRRRVKLVVDYAFGATILTAPAMLGRLGAEVLAVNATLDEERASFSGEAIDQHMEQLSRLVLASGAEVGVLFDTVGERLRLVDERGHVVSGPQALLAFVHLISRTTPSARVALPVMASRAAQDIVESHGGSVEWTPISAPELMAAAEQRGVAFAGDHAGGYIFPQFLSSHDALLSLVKLLELLDASGSALGAVVDSVPSPHVARLDVATPWEVRGTVMRRLLERAEPGAVTIDGVKTHRGRDWALVVPDRQEPVIRVWAESASEEEAMALAREFAGLVEELKA